MRKILDCVLYMIIAQNKLFKRCKIDTETKTRTNLNINTYVITLTYVLLQNIMLQFVQFCLINPNADKILPPICSCVIIIGFLYFIINIVTLNKHLNDNKFRR